MLTKIKLNSKISLVSETPTNGRIAQLGEHLPYKQRVIGSSPIVPTKYGLVVQLVRTLACHARGQGFESPSGRHFASVAQLVEQGTENPRVVGSIPTGGTIFRGFSSFGRAPPCQGGGGGFDPRNPLQKRTADQSVRCSFFASYRCSNPIARSARRSRCFRFRRSRNDGV